jgi:hypothetical protein
MSTLKTVTASIIQASAIGPAAYVAVASDLKAVTPSNQLRKFAEDTYLIIPASNVDYRTADVENVQTWARTNNLALTSGTMKEIVFIDNRQRRRVVLPPPMANMLPCHVSEYSWRLNLKWPISV